MCVYAHYSYLSTTTNDLHRYFHIYFHYKALGRLRPTTITTLLSEFLYKFESLLLKMLFSIFPYAFRWKTTSKKTRTFGSTSQLNRATSKRSSN